MVKKKLFSVKENARNGTIRVCASVPRELFATLTASE